MKKMLFVFAILLMQQTLSKAQTGDKNFIDQNYIEVTGKATLEVVPDEIYLKIVLNEDDNKGKQSVDQLDKSLYAVLTKLGIDTKSALSMRDATSNFKERKLKRPDIRAKKEYILRVNDAATVSDVFALLEEAGISNVTIEKADHSEIEKLRKDVKVSAIKVSKEKAEALTMAIGQKIGRAIYIYEFPSNENFPRFAVSNVAMDLASESMEDAPMVDFEKIKLSYSVLVRFELQ